MKGFELVKREDHYGLYNKDGHKIAATVDGCNNKLSIKNCEAIERGYDLENLSRDGLSTRFNENSGYHKFVFVEAYKEGFQKALEILGDKKFSELDMRISYDAGCNNIDADGGPIDDYNVDFQDTINSLQQTEWDVEIVTKPYTEVGEGFNLESKREPKLDADGCLILKRINYVRI